MRRTVIILITLLGILAVVIGIRLGMLTVIHGFASQI